LVHIGPKTTTPSEVDARIVRIAARQHGVISRPQLLAAGLGSQAIRYRAAHNRLHRLHNGVYAVGFPSPAPLPRAMAAVLACGPDAVLSHGSAAALWEIGRWTAPIEITAPARRTRRGIRCHESKLSRGDTTTNYGIPVTTPARTLVDLADVLDDRALTRATNDARVRRLVTSEQIAEQTSQSPGRCAQARLNSTNSHDAPTRSALEDRFLELVRAHRLPAPAVNQRVRGHEVDALWRRQRIIVELDGRAYHDHPDAFERDRARDAALLAAGYKVMRITWARLTQDPAREAATLRALLQGPFQPKS
jgi:very-short-patch-repair endonuclease